MQSVAAPAARAPGGNESDTPYRQLAGWADPVFGGVTGESGWMLSPWYGWLVPYENGWIFHAQHGWQRVVADGPASVWLFDRVLDCWLWTSSSVAPWFYKTGEHPGWVYSYPYGQAETRWFFHAGYGWPVLTGREWNPDFPSYLELVGGQLFTITNEDTEVARLRMTPSAADYLFRWSLVDGEGSDHNHLFRLQDNLLVTNLPMAGISNPVLSIRARATGPNGFALEQQFSLQVVDASGIPAIFRINNDVTAAAGIPFPVVPAFLVLDLDMESVKVQWYSEPGRAYAVEYWDSGGQWRLLPGGAYLEPWETGGLRSVEDWSADYYFTRERHYRVRWVNAPVRDTRAIEIPSAGQLAGKPAIELLSGRTIVPLPYLDEIFFDPTGQADYYEVMIPGSIGAQWRSTSANLSLELSRNFGQGAPIDLHVLGYNWNGELVSARLDNRYYGFYDEFYFQELLSDMPANLKQDPNWLGLVNIYGSAMRETLRTYYQRVDSATGSRMLGIVLDRADGSDPAYGGFTLYLPNGITPGSHVWTSGTAYNASPTGFCGMRMGYELNSWTYLGGWSAYPDFYWSSTGWPSTPTGSPRGYFQITERMNDGYYSCMEIRAHYANDNLAGVIHILRPAHFFP